MNSTLPYHVFAHKDGRYQTVLAVGLSEGQAKSLEQFIFGQTNDPRYLSSLRDEPGVIWRPVEQATALTRVHQGANDPHGRATLRFETVLISAGSSPAGAQRLAEIVLGHWEASEQGASITLKSASASGPLHPDKISDVVLAVQRAERVIQPANSFSLRDVAKIVSTSIGHSEFSLCFKSLNRTAPVLVNLLSLEVPRAGAQSPANSGRPRPLSKKEVVMPEKRVLSSQTPMAIAIYFALTVQILLFWRATNPSTTATDRDAMQGHLMTRFAKVDTATTELQTHLNQLDQAASNIGSSIHDMNKSLMEKINVIDELAHRLKKDSEEFRKVTQDQLEQHGKDLGILHRALEDQRIKAEEAASRFERQLDVGVKLQKESAARIAEGVEEIKRRFNEAHPPPESANAPKE